jgi:hypothetical protein
MIYKWFSVSVLCLFGMAAVSCSTPISLESPADARPGQAVATLTAVLPPSPPPVYPPTEAPAGEQTVSPGAPTETPQFAVPYIAQTETPTVTSDTADSALVEACALLQPEEMTFLFSNPPAPVSQSINQGERKASTCLFQDETGSLSIAVAMDILSVAEIAQHIQNIKTGADTYSANGADIYHMEGVENGQGAFVGIIYRDDVSVEISGMGQHYQANPQGEKRILELISARLPPYTRYIDRIQACSLVPPTAAAALFAHPPEPVNTMVHAGDLISECRFENEEMRLMVRLGYSSTEALKVVTESAAFQVVNFEGGEMYLSGASNSGANAGDELLAVIRKGSLLVTVSADGQQYHYNFEREAGWLAEIASRLP